MYIGKRHITKSDIRSFLFGKKNREFLIFLFFLILSSGFWLIITLNEPYETEIEVPVKYVGVPGNVVMVGSAQDTLTVRVQDRRFVLFTYLSDVLKPVNADFASCKSSENGVGILRQNDIMKQLHAHLFSSSKIVSVKPENIKFYYNYGERKKVPVKVSGKIAAAGSYYLSKVTYSPDSVTIYALRDILDSIKCIHTVPLNYPKIDDTLFVNTQLEKIEGAKCVPSNVKVGLYTDIYTEETFEVPINAVNVPEGKLLRTFPMRVNVTFVVGASMVRTLSPSQFEIVADYKDIVKNPSDKCNIHIRKYPQGVKRPRLDLNKVDYLIEEGN